MGKTMFAVALVAASFAGGVFVNGPGLQWAKSCVETRLGHALWGNDDEKPAEAGASPLIQEPTIVVGAAERKGASSVRETTSASIPPAAGLRRPHDLGPSARRGVETIASSVVLEPVPLEPMNPPPRLQTSREGERAPLSAKPREASTRDPAVVTAALPKTADGPLSASKSLMSRAATTATPQSSPDPAAGWSLLRTRMKKLGVTRYGVDGTPDGQARFHCVVPIAGDGAVAQHFEAEADDAWRAADITLKRVALWRAAESATR